MGTPNEVGKHCGRTPDSRSTEPTAEAYCYWAIDCEKKRAFLCISLQYQKRS